MRRRVHLVGTCFCIDRRKKMLYYLSNDLVNISYSAVVKYDNVFSVSQPVPRKSNINNPAATTKSKIYTELLIS